MPPLPPKPEEEKEDPCANQGGDKNNNGICDDLEVSPPEEPEKPEKKLCGKSENVCLGDSKLGGKGNKDNGDGTITYTWTCDQEPCSHTKNLDLNAADEDGPSGDPDALEEKIKELEKDSGSTPGQSGGGGDRWENPYGYDLSDLMDMYYDQGMSNPNPGLGINVAPKMSDYTNSEEDYGFNSALETPQK